jgi:hypothetical protein
MKLAILLAVILLPGVANPAQEHAPTAEQCNADERLWASQLSGVGSLPYKEIEARENEMTNCANTMDTSTEMGYLNASSYKSLGSNYRAQMGNRLQTFLIRHNLIDQFLAEDAEGKR